MDINKKISVIMGVYNDAPFLEKSILSILNQTYKNFEFIICDDCSTDDSFEIIKKFKQRDNRIVVIKNEKNLGLASTLNRCLQFCNGEYVARMDSDDISLPDRFMKQVKYLDNHQEYAVLGGQVIYIDNQDIEYRESNFLINICNEDIVRQVCVAHPTTMIRKNVLVEVGGYTVSELTHRSEDYDLWCKIMSRGYNLHNLDDILLKYREDLSGIKKRKYKYRIEEFRIKNYWRKKMNYSFLYFIFALKPLFVGMIPFKLYKILKNRKM